MRMLLSLIYLMTVIHQPDPKKYVILPFYLHPHLTKDMTAASLSAKEIDDLEELVIDTVTSFNSTAKRPGNQLLNLSEYQRQYIAWTNASGQKEVLINFLCAGWNNRGVDWRYRYIMVQDGGNCFFNMTINLSTRKVKGLMVNGYA